MEDIIADELQLKSNVRVLSEARAKKAVRLSDQYLQTSLFSLLEGDHTNCTAIYDLAPRFISRVDRPSDDAYLTAIMKDFTFNGEAYRVTVSPARIVYPDGTQRDELPGEREQLVEDVIRRMAADCMKVHQDQIEIPFTITGIQSELKKHGHTFSKSEIKEALVILNKSTIEITKIAGEGQRKAKPLLSAAAYPVLKFWDASDPESKASVQLNPLLVQAVKSLAFDQINYQWMMRVKGSLARWIFKYISLMQADPETPTVHTVELSAVEIAQSYGYIRSRWRSTLTEIENAFAKLNGKFSLGTVEKHEVFEGRKKVDIIFKVRLSDQFIADRNFAKSRRSFIEDEMRSRVGERPNTFHPINQGEAEEINISYRGIAKALPKAK